MGWAVDEPIFGLPDGSAMRIRPTFVMHQEGGTWKVVHGHSRSGFPMKKLFCFSADGARARRSTAPAGHL
jgi:hypothetical protein